MWVVHIALLIPMANPKKPAREEKASRTAYHRKPEGERPTLVLTSFRFDRNLELFDPHFPSM